MSFLAKIQGTTVLLLIVFLFGAFFRFYNLNWDSGLYFHPDERNIANAATQIHFFDNLNPHFFAYGGFTIYLYRATGEVLSFLTKDPRWATGWDTINLIGRYFSALFSSLTILLVYLLAKRLFDLKIAFVAAMIFAFTVSIIQSAHFATTESLLDFLITLQTLFALDLYQRPHLKNYLLSGIVLGLAAATKTTAVSFLIIPATAHLLLLLQRKPFFTLNKYLLFSLVLSLGVFTIFSPYTFLSWDKFMESMKFESGVATGTLPVVYTFHFIGTAPYLYQMVNFFWQMGPVALFIGLGIITILVNLIWKKDIKLLPLITFPLIYFAYAGSWHAKFIRYMLLLVPFTAVFATVFLMKINNALNPHLLDKSKDKFLIIVVSIVSVFWKILIASVLATTVLWAIAFFSIYTHEQTRITASKWIYQNIPVGSFILTEHWDDGLPVPLPDFSPSEYRSEALTIYEPDNAGKAVYLADRLSRADYILITTRRLYGSVMPLTDRYPITSKYYQLLFTQKLGYEKVAEFSSYPNIFGIVINDDSSEESFQAYDHPRPMIYKNVSHYPSSTLLNLLQ